jgi:phosphoglycolate phosphatase
VIQCHDNPDADAIASGYALYLYLREHGKRVRLIYGGRNAIRKRNLVMMVNDLQIPIEHVMELPVPQLLVTVDCQYGEGNVSFFEADEVAVLDHHKNSGILPPLSEVRSSLGSCSTLLWELLKEENFDVNNNPRLATALYYGLYTDTGEFAELAHPLDKDLRDMARFNPQMITQFRNANLSIEELEVAGAALLRTDFLEQYHCAVVKSGPCDPNILGIISDLVLEVDAVDVCLVFNVLPNGVKFSVRSCVKEVQANELAEEICKGIGSGGGHYVKAGGTISMALLMPEYIEYCTAHGIEPRMTLAENGNSKRPPDSAIKTVLERRLKDYFKNSKVIYSRDSQVNLEKMARYCRRPIPVGYVRGTDLFPVGTDITVRTMKSDIDTKIEEDTIIIIGTKGEVSLIHEASFQNSYKTYDAVYELTDAEYDPTIRANVDGKLVSLNNAAKICMPIGEITVRAKQLDHNVKLFTEWDETKYMKGSAGDYLIAISDDPHDLVILEQAIFESCYEKEDEVKKRNVRAVVFDLDGTLLDTLVDLTEAVNYALRKQQMPERTMDEVRRFVGNGVEKLMIRAIAGGKGNPKFDETFALFKEYYGIHCKDHTGPYPGILFLMEELKQQGIRMAIVSNKLDSAVKELDREYFSGYTDAAIGEMEGVARKPAPDTVEKALAELGITRDEAIYVGDSDVDIETAKNAGLPCVSVTWGFRDEAFLREHGAERIIQKPFELLKII